MDKLIDISGGEPEFDTPKHIIDAMKKALDDGYTHYGDFAGLKELREAIADKYDCYNVDVSPEHILVTPGSTIGIYITLRGMLKPGDEILTMNPCFFGYLTVLDFIGCKPIFFPRYEEEGWKIHVDDIEDSLTPKTKGIVICSPDNPTGAVLKENELKAIADIAKDNDLYVISDDIYDLITYNGVEFKSIASLPEMRERTIILNGFSKAYAMTGWRLGYVIAPNNEITQTLKTIQINTFLVANAAVQKAGVAALTGSQDCVAKMVKKHDKKRKWVVKAYNEIEGVSCTMPEGALYVFPNLVSYNISSVEISKYLLTEHRVVVSAGSRFGTNGEGHFRQSFAQPMEDIKEGIERIGNALKGLL